MPLEPQDQRHVTVAEGYAELGMHEDADAELERVTPDARHLPEVLAVRVEIYRALKKWELLRAVAKELALFAPDEPHWPVMWAYATRRAESIEAARTILLVAVERQPGVAIFHYNLACYECQLGELEVAKARLRHAFKLDERYRAMAMGDEDLEPLWDTIAAESE